MGEPTFAREATADSISLKKGAFREAGHDPEQAVNYKPERQAEILAQHVADKFGYDEVRVDKRATRHAIDQLSDLNHDAHVMAHALGIPLDQIGRGQKLALRAENARGRNATPLGSYHLPSRTLSLYGRSRSFAH